MIKSIFLTSALAASTRGSALVKQEKIQELERYQELGWLGKKHSSAVNSPQECAGEGFVTIGDEQFPCKEVDFLSFYSLQDMEIDNPLGHKSTGQSGSDIWGWLSPSGREITLMCQDNGVSFFDTTVPENPCLLAQLPSTRNPASWCDVKVYKDVAYIVKDQSGGDTPEDTDVGGEVFDLLKLEELTCDGSMQLPVYVENDYLWRYHGSAHNVDVNVETGYVYSMGSDYCAGGLVVGDLNQNKFEPEFVGCVDLDGYVHDSQCIVMKGGDPRYLGKEICFGFDVNSVGIFDMTNKTNPVLLSRTGYPSQVYTHQGSVNSDFTMVLFDDELNERCSGPAPGNESTSCQVYPEGPLDGETRTSTLVLDITDLENPVYKGAYLHPTIGIDHNLYVWHNYHKYGWAGNAPMRYPPDERFAYLNNYVSGLRVLDISSKEPSTFIERGYFDVSPELEDLVYLGAWSGYMHPSGTYALSSIDRGLFMLRPRMTFEQVTENPLAEPTASPSTEDPSDGDEGDFDIPEFEIILLVLVSLILVMVCLIFCKMNSTPATTTEQVTAVETKPVPLL
eukprot:snap_masked-scaffold_2-processed-gene-5.24-mRNA-1 protein AED:1.00 eAED:1.00 QI:0/-1/0/0/-1/1/1/0/563